jgi:hypothetical protein
MAPKSEPRLMDLIDRALNRAKELDCFLFVGTRPWKSDEVPCFSVGFPPVLGAIIRSAAKYSLTSWRRGTKPKDIEPRRRTAGNVDASIIASLDASLSHARAIGVYFFCATAPRPIAEVRDYATLAVIPKDVETFLTLCFHLSAFRHRTPPRVN